MPAWPWKKPATTLPPPPLIPAPPAPVAVSMVLPEAERKSSLTPHFESGGRVMITNGGPHPPELWAQATAEHVIQIGEGVVGERLIAAQQLRHRVQQALVPHHAAVQDSEREKLGADIQHLLSPLDPEPFLDAVMDEIQRAAKGTEWEADFSEFDSGPLPSALKQKNPRLVTIRQEIARHFRTAQHIERSWHADARPNHPTVNLWRGRN